MNANLSKTRHPSQRPAFETLEGRQLFSGYALTALVPPTGYSAFYPAAINNSGMIAGTLLTTTGVRHAGLKVGNVWHDLGLMGGSNSYATAINATGQVAGVSIRSNGSGQAFVSAANGGALTGLGVLGGNLSAACGINNAGTVVGASSIGGNGQNSDAFVAAGGRIYDLGALPAGGLTNGIRASANDINNNGIVVGSSTSFPLDDMPITKAFVVSSRGMVPLGSLGGLNSAAFAINDQNIATGYAEDSNEDQQAVIWSGSQVIALPGPGDTYSSYSQGLAINNSNQVVGSAYDRNGNVETFLWNGSATIPLNRLVTSGASGWSLGFSAGSSFASGINDSGAIVGTGIVGGRYAGYIMVPTANPTPAPATGGISGTVFNDVNGNGRKDTNERGLSGWTVYIDTNNNGRRDAGEKTATTNAAGAYQFANLQAGNYLVRQVAKTGFNQTFPSATRSTAVTTRVVTGVNFGDRAIQAGTRSVIADTFAA